ncbi:aminoglycoside phosphotransferase family protein [Paenibacillus profundus]|uniref:Aminoglycoside phosphotransferase family protein n=1 Tax=Paenibacillus profundus TaxID=1173085 RepID=A0ABS8YDD0_9BACL|nr:aminoglycoside phosphotransferase family protein [Paenibacillus profundus]MCE5170028.1 aminoglycoside phosphotransferase family protein [Paenibacillus profundus]
MKDNWERTEAPVALNLLEIEALVGPLFNSKRLTAATRISEGYSNTNYKIQLDGIDKPYVLRLYRGGEEVADKELAISRFVQDTVPVPHILCADMSCTRFERPWAVVEWKEGALLRDVLREGAAEDVIATAASVGSSLAQIHAHSFPVAGFFGKNLDVTHSFRMDSDHFLAFIEDSLFVKKSGYWLGKELAQALWSFSQRYGPQLSEQLEAPVLVHSDFNGLNILIQQSRGCTVSAVLDWEFAFSGSRLVDIANMLRYEENDSTFERHFIRSYVQSGGVLPSNWKLLSKLEDLIALCDMLNHSTAEAPNRVLDLKRLVTKTLHEYAPF